MEPNPPAITDGNDAQIGSLNAANFSPFTSKESTAIKASSSTLSDAASLDSPNATLEKGTKDAVDPHHEANIQSPEGEIHANLAEQKKKKKKKKKSKSKMSKGLGKPTGFEEFFAEAPLTPAESQQNTELYHIDKPVDQRIQTAVQRFCARRKFESGLKEIFDRYLSFGGIDSGPKMFGGGDDPDAGELTATEIAALKHPKYLNEAVLNGEMVIDFDGVLKAYLQVLTLLRAQPEVLTDDSSSYSAVWFTTEPEPEIKRRVNVLRSFFNYLLHHEVCPEYKEQVQAAKKICDVGEAQLWLIAECARQMPGECNKACSILFHGWYHDAYIRQLGDEQPDASDTRVAAAQTKFRAALASHGSAAMCEVYQMHNTARKAQPLRKFPTGLEVIRCEFATAEIKQLYKMPMFLDCKPTGKLFAREWHNPASMEEDLTDDEGTGIQDKTRSLKEYEFWIEEEILSKMFTGLKFEAEVYELTFGMYFFETPTNFRCSFFTWLPNEAMMGYRDHEHLEPREPLEPTKVEAF